MAGKIEQSSTGSVLFHQQNKLANLPPHCSEICVYCHDNLEVEALECACHILAIIPGVFQSIACIVLCVAEH
jgi:hypothetical protein